MYPGGGVDPCGCQICAKDEGETCTNTVGPGEKGECASHLTCDTESSGMALIGTCRKSTSKFDSDIAVDLIKSM